MSLKNNFHQHPLVLCRDSRRGSFQRPESDRYHNQLPQESADVDQARLQTDGYSPGKEEPSIYHDS